MSAKTLSHDKLLCFEVSTVSTWGRPISLSPLLSAAHLSAPACWQDFDYVPPFWAKHSAGCAFVYFLWAFYRYVTTLWLASCTTDCSTSWLADSLGVSVSPNRKWNRRVSRALEERGVYVFVHGCLFVLRCAWECGFAVVRWLHIILEIKKERPEKEGKRIQSKRRRHNRQQKRKRRRERK